MRIHILSDLHLEVNEYEPHIVECDVVVLAGDISKNAEGIEWARDSWPDKEIVFVPGNHEFYRVDRTDTLELMQLIADQYKVHLLDNHEVVIGGVRFLGSTLWTDFNLFGEGARQSAIANGKNFLNDFLLIRDRGEIFTPEQSIVLHQESVAWLSAKKNEKFDGKTVVVTHHLPSMRSVSDRYKTSLLSACFASYLNELIGFSDLWIHGHTHESIDYVLDGTRVICNPRGYSRYLGTQENHEFNPGLVVEI